MASSAPRKHELGLPREDLEAMLMSWQMDSNNKEFHYLYNNGGPGFLLEFVSGYYLNEDKTVCHIHEHYRDSEGLKSHAENFGKVFAERFTAACTPTKLILYGTPNAAAKAVMEQYGAIYFTKIQHYTEAGA